MSEYRSSESLWYVVHTYSGYENKVKDTLVQTVEAQNLHDKIQVIDVPMEETLEIKDGKKKIVQRKLYPGYVLVKMKLDEKIWYTIRNTRGVTGFVGPDGEPEPLSEEELISMGLGAEVSAVVDYEVGDAVKVIYGPLDSFIGTVTEVNVTKRKVTVLVSMFGRETPVELDFTQVLRV